MWERVFVTSDGHAGARLRAALAVGNLTAAEQAAFEVPFVPLTEARALLELYAEQGEPKFERAALRYLRRYLDEADPSLADVAGVAAVLAARAVLLGGSYRVAASTPASGSPPSRSRHRDGTHVSRLPR
jgi:hypothetical protein